jgi:hypothetical protein
MLISIKKTKKRWENIEDRAVPLKFKLTKKEEGCERGTMAWIGLANP